MFRTQKTPFLPRRAAGVFGVTVSVTGFSVAQTGFSVAQTVAPAGDFRPAAVLFGVSLQRRGCSRFWPQNSRFAHSVQWRMVFLGRGPKQRRQRSLPYKVVEAGPVVVHFSDDNHTAMTTYDALCVAAGIEAARRAIASSEMGIRGRVKKIRSHNFANKGKCFIFAG